MKKSKCKKIKRKGFTLIEVLIAITIVVILASLSVPKVAAYIDKAKDAKALTCGKQIYTAAMWSYSDQGNKFIKNKVEESISTATNVIVSIEANKVTDSTAEINFSSDNKNYTLAISDSGNSYVIKEGNNQIYPK
ncbi:type II secretion system protein [Clostridium sp. YIM B02515]|uniref:Type II secretion system protein n=1 Tax=Clostridium rhizosphaerae TaxID=2803861 RepID=A0ABS1TGM0_9CLOT|nr:type II secretion system protein [Clostridium rhizosphaerae]MBL4937927.1 type II secretion system protein [Clostridium rhizosphaerae]